MLIGLDAALGFFSIIGKCFSPKKSSGARITSLKYKL